MDSNVVVVKKKHTFLKVVGVLLAVGAACVVAAKLYQKFFKKKQVEAIEAEAEEELPELEDCCVEEAPVVEEETFEASAEAVIANAEDMEEPTND